MSSDDQEEPPNARPIPKLPRLCNRAPARCDRHLYATASARSTRSTTGTLCAPASAAPRSRHGPQSIWRYADLLPVSAPEDARLAPGMTPLVPAPRLAEELGIGELWLKLDTANPTHSFKDRVVAVAARKAQELGLRHALVLLDRQPRRRRRRTRSGGGPRCRRLRPERPRAREARRGRRLRAADLRRRRHVRPLLAALGRAVVRAAVGVRQRQPALVLRRGIEDARLRDRRAARLGDARRRGDPDRVGRAVPQGRPGLSRSLPRSASSTARLRRSSAARRPAASRWQRHSGRVSASCPSARTASRARSRSAIPPTATSRSRPRGRPAARSTRCAEDEIGTNMADLAATTGVFGETATGVTLGALRAAVAAGEVGPDGACRAPRHRRRVEDARPGVAHLPSHHDRGRRRRVRGPGAGRLVGRSLFDKVWDRHVVRDEPGEPTLIYIDLHLVHEVTSPQAFDGLRLAGRSVRRPELTVATMDHNVPTLPGPITDPLAKAQLDALRANCEEFGIELHGTGSGTEGIVHVIGPELGLTQPGKTIVCGDSHTSTHGAFGALAFGIGTSEVEHVLATQTLNQQRPKTMLLEFAGALAARADRKGHDPRRDRPGRSRRRRRLCRRVRRRGGAGSVDGAADDDLQHDDRVGSTRRHDRSRRDDVRLPRRPPTRAARARPGSTPSRTGVRSAPTRMRSTTPTSSSTWQTSCRR